MFNVDKLDKKLKESLSNERYEHSVSVMHTAVDLAARFGQDEHMAAFLGLYHDLAKEYTLEKCRDICVENNYITGDENNNLNLLHGPVAAFLFRQEFGPEVNEDYFNAIFYHTTGKDAMSLLGKIIYIADKIEPLNDFPGIHEIRKAAGENLNKALLMLFDRSIIRVVNKRQYLHPDTVEARNYYLKEEK